MPPQLPTLLLQLWPLWSIPILIIIIRILYWIYRRRQIFKAGIHELDHMSGSEFEAYLTWLFSKLGFQSVNVGDTGDFGADVIGYFQKKKFIIQAKRYNHPVGVEAIQQTVAAKGYYQGDHAIVVTNSKFTPAAKKLATANNIELWDRHQLIHKIFQVQN